MTLIRSDAIYAPPRSIAGTTLPDSMHARQVTGLVKDAEPPLLFHRSSRVYYWGALTGKPRGPPPPQDVWLIEIASGLGLWPQRNSIQANPRETCRNNRPTATRVRVFQRR